MMEARRALSKQIFQLSYHGKIDALYASGLEVSERNYLYKLLKEQLDAEEQGQQNESRKAAAQTASMRSKASSPKKR